MSIKIDKKLEEILSSILESQDKMNDRLEALEKKKEPKKTRSNNELAIQAYKYLLHRGRKHSNQGLFKHLAREEWKRMEESLESEISDFNAYLE